MGINSGIHVYGLRKPTIYASLVEGGSLAPNTTYYIVGAMKYSTRVYNAIASPFSNVVQITTTTTALSIQLSHKTFRDISAFADNGDSRTLVTSDRYCLKVGDEFKIDSGSYAGTWDVDEWVNYNQFIINTPYIDNVAVQFYTDSQIYNYPHPDHSMGYTTATGVVYHIYQVHPYTDGVFTGGTRRYSDAAYTANHVSNPTIITTQPSGYFYGGNIEMLYLGKGLLSILIDYGNVLVAIDEGAKTLSTIYDEVQESGFTYNCTYSSGAGYSTTPHFMLHGAIKLYNDSSITVAYVNIVIISGELFHNSGSRDDLMSMVGCSVNYFPSTFSAYTYLQLDGGAFINHASSNAITGYFWGDNISIHSTIRFNATLTDETITKTNRLAGTQSNFGLVKNKTFRQSDTGQFNQVSYAAIGFRNCTVIPAYFIFANNVLGDDPDLYMMENCKVITTIGWHWRFYSYKPASYFRYRFLNVDTDDPNNVKKIVHNSLVNVDAEFYRRVEFYVQDDGICLEGVIITIKDGSGNEYSESTDANGYAFIDCLEQLTAITNDKPASSSTHDPAYDTHYTDFDIKLTKNGYYPVEMEFDTFLGNEMIKLSMESGDQEYVESIISADLEEDIITGKI